MSPRSAVLIIFRALESHGAVSANASASAWEALSTRQIGDIIATAIYGIRERYDENPTVARIFTSSMKDELRVSICAAIRESTIRFTESIISVKKKTFNMKNVRYCN